MSVPEIFPSSSPDVFPQRLEDILINCALIPSAEKGLIGDTGNITVSGDGSALPTGASGNGKPSCKCHENLNITVSMTDTTPMQQPLGDTIHTEITITLGTPSISMSCQPMAITCHFRCQSPMRRKPILHSQ
jgi:hypothetical protein